MPQPASALAPGEAWVRHAAAWAGGGAALAHRRASHRSVPWSGLGLVTAKRTNGPPLKSQPRLPRIPRRWGRDGVLVREGG